MTALRYGSVCSGIEAATVAWHPLGWRPQFFSEIDAAPCAVLSHHYPEVPLHGDFTTIQDGQYGSIDLLVGGTPCQSFSVAGLRGGLADDRGNLALQYLRLAQRLRPRWLVWENVPGVLSSNGGRDFGAILGGMGELGYGVAYRVLDAQYIRTLGFERAVPQRRRRVFVVGYLGDWRRAAAVLFERASLRGDLAPRRSPGAGSAAAAVGGAGAGGGSSGRPPSGRPATQAFGGGQNCNPTDVSTALSAHPGGRYDLDLETFVAQTLLSGGHSNNPLDENLVAACLNGISEYSGEVPTLRAKGGDAAGGSEALIAFNSRQDPDVTWDRAGSLSSSSPQAEAIAFSCKDYGADATDSGVTPTLRAMGHSGSHANAGGQMAVAVSLRGREGGGMIEMGDDCAMALRASQGGGDKPHALIGHNGGPTMWAVRRLTPLECERLQGFPDGYTLVPTARGMMADGPRYKALGNSMAVNAMRWIGRRIDMVERIASASATLVAAE